MSIWMDQVDAGMFGKYGWVQVYQTNSFLLDTVKIFYPHQPFPSIERRKVKFPWGYDG